MSFSNISPTRIQLKNLTSKLAIAKRGHKMLKDKNDEMVRLFTSMIKQTIVARKRVEEELNQILDNFILVKGGMSYGECLNVFLPIKSQINYESNHKMNMEFPKIILSNGKSELPYSHIEENLQLGNLVQKMQDIMPNLLKLSSLEKSCQMLAQEIERTKRRVNALEFIMIPDLEKNIKSIKFKLEENDRASRIRLIKYKDINKKSK